MASDEKKSGDGPGRDDAKPAEAPPPADRSRAEREDEFTRRKILQWSVPTVMVLSVPTVVQAQGHSDVHGDMAHVDEHADVPHADGPVESHSDGGPFTIHTDFASHSDHSDTDPLNHFDSVFHFDQSDVVHADHSDVAHGDSAHADSHSDVPHGDAG